MNTGGQADSSGQADRADRADSKRYKNTHHRRTPHRGKFFFFFICIGRTGTPHDTRLVYLHGFPYFLIPPRSKPSAIRTRGGRGPLDIGAAIRIPPPFCTKNRHIFRACAGKKSQKARKQHAKRQGKPAGQHHSRRQDGRTAPRQDSRTAPQPTAGRQDSTTAGRQDSRTAPQPTAGRQDSRTAPQPTAGRQDSTTADGRTAGQTRRADRRRNALYNVAFRNDFPGG